MYTPQQIEKKIKELERKICCSNSTTITTTSAPASSLPYKLFSGTLLQSGTGNPIILNTHFNTLGFVPVITRLDVGRYLIDLTPAGPDLYGKISCFTSNSTTGLTNFVQVDIASENGEIYIYTWIMSSGSVVYQDDILTGRIHVEIKIFD